MRKHCPNVCKLRLCLATESTNSARMRSIVTAVLQRQYSQTELIFFIPYVYSDQQHGNLASPAAPSADASFRTVRNAHDTQSRTWPPSEEF